MKTWQTRAVASTRLGEESLEKRATNVSASTMRASVQFGGGGAIHHVHEWKMDGRSLSHIALSQQFSLSCDGKEKRCMCLAQEQHDHEVSRAIRLVARAVGGRRRNRNENGSGEE